MNDARLPGRGLVGYVELVPVRLDTDPTDATTITRAAVRETLVDAVAVVDIVPGVWRVREGVDGGQYVVHVLVPASAVTVEYADETVVLRVDPATLDPLPPAVAWWESALDAEAAARAAADVTLTTAVAEKVAKGDLVIDARDYGAFASGSTAAVNAAAVNAAQAALAAGGGRVLLPPGIYDCLGITHEANVHLDGPGCTLRHPDGDGTDIIAARTYLTTGAVTAGSAVLTVASATGVAVGAVIGIRGAGGISPTQNTALLSSVDATQTTGITLTATTGFPAAGNVQCGTEIIGYTGISTATLTGVTRGAYGTTAAAHTAGDVIGTALRHVTEVAAISGTTVTLNDPAVLGVTAAPVTTGIVGPKITGIHLDGNRPVGGAVATTYGVRWDMVRWGHVELSASRCDGALYFGQGTRDCRFALVAWDCSVPESSRGSTMWMFQQCHRNVGTVHISGDIWVGLYLDNRTTLATEWDGPCNDNEGNVTVHALPRTPRITNSALVIIGGNRNRFDLRASDVRTGLVIGHGDQAYDAAGALPNARGNIVTPQLSGVYQPWVLDAPGNLILGGYYESVTNGPNAGGSLIVGASQAPGGSPVAGAMSAGTQSAPGLAVGETNTGAFLIAAGQLQFVLGSVMTMRLWATGLRMDSGKGITWGGDNNADIGQLAGSRPRDVHVAQDVRAARVVKPGVFTTAARPSPSVVGAGAGCFDSTLGKPIWSTGTAWVDATDAAEVTTRRGFTRSAAAALTPLVDALDDGLRSTAIQILGDSTGNDPTEWPTLLATAIAADYPAWSVHTRLWSDATQDYAPPVTITTGTAGGRFLDGSTGTSTRRLDPSVSPHIAGVIDARFRMSLTDWTPAAQLNVGGKSDAPGFRGWYLFINSTTGRPGFAWSVDGTAVAAMSAYGAPVVADGETIWLRVVFTPDNGAGNRTARFYQSVDGQTWTQIASTVSAVGAVTLYNNAATGYTIGGLSVAGNPTMRTYEVQVRDGENGPSVVPALPDLWPPYDTNAADVVGAPVLTVVNGSHPGAALAYLSARLPLLTPDYGQALTVLSVSHNQGPSMGRGFTAAYDTLRTAVATSVLAPTVIVTQNPQGASAYPVEHAQRRLDLLTYARQHNIGLVDTYRAFIDYGDWQGALMADSVHPNAAGSQVWADAILAAFDAAATP